MADRSSQNLAPRPLNQGSVAPQPDTTHTVGNKPPLIEPESLGTKLMHVLKVVSIGTACFMGGQLVGPLMVGIIALVFFRVPESQLTTLFDENIYARFAALAAAEACAVWFVLLYVRRWRKKLSSIGIPGKPTWLDAGRGAAVYIVYMVIYLLVVTAVSKLQLIDFDQKQQIGFDNPQGLELLATYVAIAVLPPIAEEIVFRGLLFFGLKQKLRPLYAGLITSLLFGAAHLEIGSGSSLNFAAAFDTFILSCILCYAANRFKSVWPGVVTHALKNGVVFLLLFVFKVS